MYRFVPFFLLSIAILFTACNQATETTTEDPAERQQFLASAEPMPEFTTTVLEAELASPRKEMSGNLDGVGVTVNYGSPSVKGRTIWDSLVPYGEVWRTGANEATRITLDHAVKVGGEELAARTYGLFTIPSNGNWEVIFNREADQWGAYEYNAEADVLRVQAQPQMKEDLSETLEFSLGRNAVVLEWGKLRLPIPLIGV